MIVGSNTPIDVCVVYLGDTFCVMGIVRVASISFSILGFCEGHFWLDSVSVAIEGGVDIPPRVSCFGVCAIHDSPTRMDPLQ